MCFFLYFIYFLYSTIFLLYYKPYKLKSNQATTALTPDEEADEREDGKRVGGCCVRWPTGTLQPPPCAAPPLLEGPPRLHRGLNLSSLPSLTENPWSVPLPSQASSKSCLPLEGLASFCSSGGGSSDGGGGCLIGCFVDFATLAGRSLFQR